MQSPPCAGCGRTRKIWASTRTGSPSAADLRALGNHCDLLLYEGARHGFFNQRDKGQSWFEETLANARRFFAELGGV